MIRHHHRRLRAHALRQTTEAFYNSLRHVEALTFGLNCALGLDELRQYVQELSRIAECYVTAPNAGLPNAFAEYDLDADTMAKQIREWAEAGFLNIVGGCCGTTPQHIAAISRAVGRISAAQTTGNSRSLPLVRPGAAEHWRR